MTAFCNRLTKSMKGSVGFCLIVAKDPVDTVTSGILFHAFMAAYIASVIGPGHEGYYKGQTQ